MKKSNLTDKDGNATTGFSRAMAFADMKTDKRFWNAQRTLADGTTISMNTGRVAVELGLVY